MKHKIVVFSPQGDSAVAEWEETDVEQVAKARGAFNAARAEGFAAVTMGEGGAKALGEFDPAAEEIVLLRPIAGG